jgi:hypothetical protein
MAAAAAAATDHRTDYDQLRVQHRHSATGELYWWPPQLLRWLLPVCVV